MLSDAIDLRVVRSVGETPRPDGAELARRDAGEELLSHVSHEMRTPLNVVYQFVSIVLDELDGPLSDEQRSHLQTALDNVNQLRAVIGDLLDLRRIERDSFSVDPIEANVDALGRAVVASLRPTARSEGLRLFFDAERDLPMAWVDPARFRQVLTNLLDNAIKFTPHGGEIRVSIQRSQAFPERVEVVVADTGVGIRADEIAFVFDHMAQGSTRTRSHAGLGLGLHICRLLVERLGGQISVESQEGRGSRFAFTIPVAEADADGREPDPWIAAELAAGF